MVNFNNTPVTFQDSITKCW